MAESLKSSVSGTPSRLSLRANFSWTFLGNVIFAACQWGMLIVLAKLGTPEMVGQFALGSAIAVPVLMLTNLQLRDVQATDAREEYAFADYFGLRLITVVVALLIIGAIVLVLRYPIETALVVVAFGLFKAVEAISDVIFGMLQHHERMDRVAQSMILRGVLSLAALGVLVYVSGSVFWGVMGLVFAGIGVVLLFDLRSVMLIKHATPGAGLVHLVRSLRPRWNWRTLLALTWLALPLGVSMLLISLATSLPRFFVGHYLGEYTLGIFAALTYLQVAGMTVVSALGQSALPRLSQYYAAGDRAAFSRLLLRMGAIGVALGAGGIAVAVVAGRPLLTLIYQPEYATYAWFFVWVMVSAAIGYISWLIGEGMKAARYLRVQVALFGVQVAVLVALSVWLIPTMGMTGVAIVMIAAAAVHLVGTLLILAHAIVTLPACKGSEAR